MSVPTSRTHVRAPHISWTRAHSGAWPRPWPFGDSRDVIDVAWRGDQAAVLYKTPRRFAVVDIAERQELISLPIASGALHTAALSLDARWLAVARDGRIDASALGGATETTPALPPPRLVLQTSHRGLAPALAVSQDGRIMAMAGADGWLTLWNLESGRLFRPYFHRNCEYRRPAHPPGP